MGLFIVFIIIIIYVALSQSVKQSNNQNRRGNNPAMGRPPQQIYRPQMNQPQRTYQQAPAQQHTYQQTMNQPKRAYQQASAQPQEASESEEQANPFLLRFLDADTYEEKYKILNEMENDITDRLINDFSVVLDVVIPEGDLIDRYIQLKQCVATMCRYETTRLR